MAKGYTTIPDWMLELDLDIYETVILGVIFGFSQDGESMCKSSLKTFMRKAKCGRTKTIDSLKRLIELGLVVKVEKEVNGVKVCEYAVSASCEGGTPHGQVVRHADGGSTPHGPNNNINNNISCSHKRTREKIDFDFAGALRAAGVTDQHIKEWMVIRADKKAKDSETAFKGFLREAETAGFTPDEAVTRCIEETWKGFRAAYVQERFPRQGGAPRQPQQKESLVDHNRKAMEQVIDMLMNE